MKKKSVICTALSAVMGLSLLAFAGCSPKQDDTVVLNVKTPYISMSVPHDPDIATSGDFLTKAARAYEIKNGGKVQVSVGMFPEGAERQFVTDTFGTEDAADVLYDDFFNMITYVHSGMAIPLDGLLTAEARADLKTDYLEWGRVTGKDQDGNQVTRTYMLPFLGRQNILMYNKEMLREYGLGEYVEDGVGIIQNWSVDEWEKILDTLAAGMKAKMEAGSDKMYAPTMMYAKDSSGDTHIMSLLSVFGSDLVGDDGYFHFEEEAAVKGLAWLQQGVERGWYMPHSQALSMSDCDRLFHDGHIAFYVFNIGSEIYKAGREKVAKYGYVNFPNDENGLATRFVTGFEIFDNGNAEKLAAARDFVKYIYETEEWLDASAGSISASKRVTLEQEEANMLMIDQFTQNIRNVVHFMRGNPNWQGQENSVRNVFYKNISNLLAGRVTPEECAAKLNTDCNAATKYGWDNSKMHD